MANYVRARGLSQQCFSQHGETDNRYADRIPHSDKVERGNPARASILILLHDMEQAGVSIDATAVDIATRLGEWQHQQTIAVYDVQPGDVVPRQRGRREAGARQTWVYYIRIGHLVKIGASMALTTRFCTLRPNEVLALEPGGEVLEQELHHRFAHLRASGEYFHPGPALQEHILRVREERGAPNWSASIVPDGQDFFPRTA